MGIANNIKLILIIYLFKLLFSVIQKKHDIYDLNDNTYILKLSVLWIDFSRIKHIYCCTSFMGKYPGPL